MGAISVAPAHTIEGPFRIALEWESSIITSFHSHQWPGGGLLRAPTKFRIFIERTQSARGHLNRGSGGSTPRGQARVDRTDTERRGYLTPDDGANDLSPWIQTVSGRNPNR